MARLNTNEFAHQRQTRADNVTSVSSMKAGTVYPVAYIPLLRGDSASGVFSIQGALAEMPRPLLTGVDLNVQAWFVPKSAYPQFAGKEDFLHAYHGEAIRTLGAADRTPPAFFNKSATGADTVTIEGSDFFKTLGISVPSGSDINHDLIDAFWLVYNFRLASHSSKLLLKDYASANLASATTLPPAFWPSGALSRVVADYERALMLGSFDLDVAAGQLPIKALNQANSGNASALRVPGSSVLAPANVPTDLDGNYNFVDEVWADMGGQPINVTLADMDKARKTQAFAKYAASMAGNDSTGFNNEAMLLAELMQGFGVEDEHFNRPWLLDSKRVPFGMVEHRATDAANLDASLSEGAVGTQLRLNVPGQDVGGIIIVTAEVVPERLHERQSDEFLHLTTVDELPDALRDTQRVEPVDIVPNRRIDAKHTTPDAAFGFEPMNDRWNRTFTRFGGKFQQTNPAVPNTSQRSAIWQPEVVDPTYNEDHFLCPVPFPQSVFSATSVDCFEFVARHSVQIVGLTQIGDVLIEDNSEFETIELIQE